MHCRCTSPSRTQRLRGRPASVSGGAQRGSTGGRPWARNRSPAGTVGDRTGWPLAATLHAVACAHPVCNLCWLSPKLCIPCNVEPACWHGGAQSRDPQRQARRRWVGASLLPSVQLFAGAGLMCPAPPLLPRCASSGRGTAVDVADEHAQAATQRFVRVGFGRRLLAWSARPWPSGSHFGRYFRHMLGVWSVRCVRWARGGGWAAAPHASGSGLEW